MSAVPFFTSGAAVSDPDIPADPAVPANPAGPGSADTRIPWAHIMAAARVNAAVLFQLFFITISSVLFSVPFAAEEIIYAECKILWHILFNLC